MTQQDLHETQSKILTDLLFKQNASFSELNTEDISSDKFTFHLNKLIEKDLISKDDNNKYNLTIAGKEFANRLDTDTFKIERQPKLTQHIICLKEEDGKTFILMQRRLKHPFYGYLGFMGGKVRWGETIAESASREMMEESGISGNVEFIGIDHKMEYDENKNLLEDKFYLLSKVISPKGTLLDKFEGGENIWMLKEDILKEEKLFSNVLPELELLEKNKFDWIEKKFEAKEY